MGRVEGKVALVTGAGSGLGAAIATHLHREGAVVTLTDVNLESVQQVASELGGLARALALDVREETAWRATIAEIDERCGGLDVLVNNAGIVIVASIEDTTIEQLRLVEAVNIEGPFLGCKHAIPVMARTGGGSIINIASTASLAGSPPYAAYSASKGAVRSLTQTVAVHCKQRENAVRCNSIHPGGMDTPLVRNIAVQRDEGKIPPLTMELLARRGGARESRGDPADVAHAAVYLASDEARFVNGAMLTVDDGLTAG